MINPEGTWTIGKHGNNSQDFFGLTRKPDGSNEIYSVKDGYFYEPDQPEQVFKDLIPELIEAIGE